MDFDVNHIPLNCVSRTTYDITNKKIQTARRRSSYCGDTWKRYCCLTGFFPIVDTCLSCEDMAWQSCAMVRRWRLFGDFCVLYFQPAVCNTFQTCILNLH